MPASGAIYDENTHDTHSYYRTMDIDVKNIDENDKNTWRKIYEAIDEPYFGYFTLFTKVFIENCEIIQITQKIFHMKSIRRLKP